MPLNIYKASAGSGKTYTLTQEYLRHLLKPHTQVRNILAITFTNAATADMKRKIVEALAASDHPQARTKLQEVLHQYQDFSIKTIDSFVQNIIKPFAFELGLPRNYTPQIEEDRLSEEITTALLDRFGRKGYEKLSLYIDKYLQKQEQDQKSLRIQDKICHVVKLLFQEKSIEALESLQNLKTEDFEPVINNIETRLAQTEQQAAEALHTAREIILKNNLTSADFIGGTRGIFTWFSLEEPDLKKFSQPGSSVQKAVQQGILKRDLPCAADLLEVYERLTGLDFAQYFLLKEVLNSIYSLALLNHAREILHEREESTGDIPISEFNQKIDKALSEEGNDFIFERCGKRYRHIFIDEFQDTSRLQWKNLRPLIEDNLAQGNDCLIVGDAKQSLYRFRSADMEQFVNLCQEGAKSGKTLIKVNRLESNWRSTPGIIAFNNLFYDFIREKFDFGEGLAKYVYADVRQYYKNKTEQWPEPDPEAVRIYQVKNVDNEFAEGWYLQQITEILNRLRDEASARGETFQAGDVAVLCRKNKHCRIVSDYLVSAGYKVSTPDSLTLASHPALQLVVASLEYLHFKHSFYKAKTFNLALNLGLWEKGASANAYEIFRNPQTARRFESLAKLAQNQADLYDTVEAVLRFWGLDEHTDQYLLCFLDQIGAQKLEHIPELVDWWNQYAEKTCVSSEAGAQDSLRVMSIHKSKGLEFKVVIMPFVSESSLHTEELFWTGQEVLPDGLGLPNALVRYVSALQNTALADDITHEKQLIELDNLNALYVATTRPCEKLYILNKVPKKSYTSFNTNAAIDLFVQEHPEYLAYEEDGAVLETPHGTEDAFSKDAGEDARTPYIARASSPASLPAPKAPLSSSRPWRQRLKEAPLAEPASTPEQEWGNFIHQTLSLIESNDSTKVNRALQIALQTYPHFKDRLEEARREIEQIWQHPLLAPYFDGTYTVKNEYPIATSEGIFIPDRLLIKNTETVILDYKTGAPSDSHRRQIENYKNILLQMGYPAPKACLIYLNPLRIEEV